MVEWCVRSWVKIRMVHRSMRNGSRVADGLYIKRVLFGVGGFPFLLSLLVLLYSKASYDFEIASTFVLSWLPQNEPRALSAPLSKSYYCYQYHLHPTLPSYYCYQYHLHPTLPITKPFATSISYQPWRAGYDSVYSIESRPVQQSLCFSICWM